MSLPEGMRVTFADEIPTMPTICSLAHHPPHAHKHAGVGAAWFYRPAEPAKSEKP
jgi:hypothetical protein